MSRSWLDRYLNQRFGISTLYLGRPGGGPAAAGDGQTPAWQAPVLALQEQIERGHGERNGPFSRRLKIVVTNELVRYVLVPRTDQRLDAAERVEFARTLFVERYGGHGAWHIALEKERFDAPTLAAAMDSALVEAIKALCSGARLKLISLAPALTENFRQQRAVLNKAISGWFVDGSDGRLAALAFGDGEWVQVSNEPGQELLPLLRRDTIRHPRLADGKVFVTNLAANLERVEQSWPLMRLGTQDIRDGERETQTGVQSKVSGMSCA